jgi:hypothetical protein
MTPFWVRDEARPHSGCVVRSRLIRRHPVSSEGWMVRHRDDRDSIDDLTHARNLRDDRRANRVRSSEGSRPRRRRIARRGAHKTSRRARSPLRRGRATAVMVSGRGVGDIGGAARPQSGVDEVGLVMVPAPETNGRWKRHRWNPGGGGHYRRHFRAGRQVLPMIRTREGKARKQAPTMREVAQWGRHRRPIALHEQ